MVLNKLVNTFKRVEYLKDSTKKEEDGTLSRLPKKGAALLRREKDKLFQNLGGLTGMTQIVEIQNARLQHC